jgi:hypothetical protein
MCNESSEEVYKKTYLREMSEAERQGVMKSMFDNFDAQNEPEVGIFWYVRKLMSFLVLLKWKLM